ncbi:MAG: hypothetical protein KME17_28455 [Cyanosarcina radialis HA8281-LM2]|jgi:hypothetical protein|nr:hypothetical protein [Cyanosarcina radialis HA8281-LM2]
MANSRSDNEETMSEEVAQNPGMRAAAIDADPNVSAEEARNAAAGESSNAAGSPAPSSAEDYIPSRSDPHPTNLASTDHPYPDDSENPDEETIGSSGSFSGETGDRYAH